MLYLCIPRLNQLMSIKVFWIETLISFYKHVSVIISVPLWTLTCCQHHYSHWALRFCSPFKADIHLLGLRSQLTRISDTLLKNKGTAQEDSDLPWLLRNCVWTINVVINHWSVSSASLPGGESWHGFVFSKCLHLHKERKTPHRILVASDRN